MQNIKELYNLLYEKVLLQLNTINTLIKTANMDNSVSNIRLKTEQVLILETLCRGGKVRREASGHIFAPK